MATFCFASFYRKKNEKLSKSSKAKKFKAANFLNFFKIYCSNFRAIKIISIFLENS